MQIKERKRNKGEPIGGNQKWKKTQTQRKPAKKNQLPETFSLTCTTTQLKQKNLRPSSFHCDEKKTKSKPEKQIKGRRDKGQKDESGIST